MGEIRSCTTARTTTAQWHHEPRCHVAHCASDDLESKLHRYDSNDEPTVKSSIPSNCAKF